MAGRLSDRRRSEHHGLHAPRPGCTGQPRAARQDAPAKRAPRAEVVAASKRHQRQSQALGTPVKARPWGRLFWRVVRGPWRPQQLWHRGAEAARSPAWGGSGTGGAQQTQPWGHVFPQGAPGPQLSAGAEDGSRGEQGAPKPSWAQEGRCQPSRAPCSPAWGQANVGCWRQHPLPSPPSWLWGQPQAPAAGAGGDSASPSAPCLHGWGLRHRGSTPPCQEPRL